MKLLNIVIYEIKHFFDPFAGLPREIYVIFIARIVTAMGLMIFPLMTLILRNKIGLNTENTGLILTLSSLAFPLFATIGGKIADSCGRKKILVLADTLGGLCFLSCGFLEPSLIMVGLIILGSGFFGMGHPAQDAMISDYTSPEQRESAYALVYLGFNIGFAVGPAIGGFLFARNHLNWMFIGDAFTTLVAILLIGVFIKEKYVPEKAEDQSPEISDSSESSVFNLLMKRKILLFFPLTMALVTFMYSQWQFLIPEHMSQLFGRETGGEYYGYMASFNGILVIIFTPIMTKIFKQIRLLSKIIFGAATYAIGFGMLSFLNSLPFFFISAFIFTMGEIMIVLGQTPFIMNRTPETHRGRVSAVMPIISGTGFALGPMIIGLSLNHNSIAMNWVFVGCAGCAAVFLLFLISLYDKKNYPKLNVSCTSSR